MSRKIFGLGLFSFLALSPSLVSALQSECYSNIGDLKIHMGSTYQSWGMCQSHCEKYDYSVYGVKAKQCWCGDKLPPTSAKVPKKECNEACPGYPSDNCGGDDVWTILYDSSSNPEHSKAQSSSSEPKSSTTEPKATLSVNPNLVATGAATQTSIPNSILTAPTTAPKNADVAEPSALAATQASSSSSSASSSADPESSSNGAAVPASPASVGSVVGAILLPLVLGSAF
ncbi:WSC domain-containing protein [Aspergillus affinis]|uniref:WSC domain-containing protein n=1 Tax=Aspergillus affinis TaxID=1070780 RepID=UPI0022FE7C3F|nr:uncharacterized protein KD926_006953 [Aspergillus affinis]KAI9041377.1 hypothetical protein KD926_006953 [Aspergillus affinis]